MQISRNSICYYYYYFFLYLKIFMATQQTEGDLACFVSVSLLGGARATHAVRSFAYLYIVLALRLYPNTCNVRRSLHQG